MDGSPPPTWRYAALAEVAEVVSGGTPSRDVERYWGGPIPWATPSEISNGSVRYLRSTRDSVTEAGAVAAGLRILPVNSVLVTTRATIGAVARAAVPMTTNQGFQNLVPRADTDAAWLFHAAKAARPVLRSLAAGSTFKEVSRESFRKLRLLVPPKAEQQAIAIILDAIDEAIERTEEVIAGVEALRQGLLADLLTRGVGGRHTDWKHVPELGVLPRCWRVERLGQLLRRIEAGGAPERRNRPAQSGEWGVLRVGAVTWGEYRPGENKALVATGPIEARLEVRPGDLLLSRANTPEFVGRTVFVRETPPRMLLSDKTLRLVADPSKTSEAFLHVALSSAASRRQLSGAASGSSKSMFNVSQEGLRSVAVPLPPVEEQRLIVEVADELRTRKELEAAALSRLQMLRRAASDALLAGSIRVSRRSAALART